MKYSVHTHNLIPLITLYNNQIYLPRDCKWYPSLSSLLLLVLVQYVTPMSGDIGKSHWICEYLSCNNKTFFTWLYVTIILNPLSLSLPIPPLLHHLFVSSTELSNPSFKIIVFEPLLRYIIRLINSLMY